MRNAVLKAYHSPYWIPGLSVVAVLALMLASFTVVQFIRAEAEDDRKSVAADIASCERQNRNSENVRDMGRANHALVAGIIEASLAGADPEQAETFRALLEPLFNDYKTVVEGFSPVDCDAIVPGGAG